MNTIFCSPLRYTQGPNATESLGSEMSILGLTGPVFIVTSASPKRILEATWKKTLDTAGFQFFIHDFGGECSHAEIKNIIAAATTFKCATILGAGGGKVIDAARAAAAALKVPFISCPTIASSDAPCSALSIVYSEEGIFEEVCSLPQNPALVLVDTQVIAQAPPRTLVAGIGDALSKIFEVHACVLAKKANTRGGSCSQAALALAELSHKAIFANAEEALHGLEKKSVTPALERLIEANILLSGLGFESGGLAAAHAVHNGLTAIPNTHPYFHGEKVAFGVMVQLMLEGANRTQLNEVLSFSRKVGLPTKLADIGCADISQEAIAQVAARATIPVESIHNEPFEVTAKMVEEAIREADAVGRSFQP